MSDAWMVRGAERQHLLEELKRALFKAEEEYERFNVDFLVASALLIELRYRQIGGPPLVHRDDVGVSFVMQKVVPTILRFARTSEEETVMIAEFAKYVLGAACGEFYTKLQSQEIMEPRKVFNAESATAQV